MTAVTPSLRSELAYGRDLARAFGGALIFGFPLLMTMEMWEFGLLMDRWRLALFLLASLPLLFGLSVYAGFRHSEGLRDDVFDTLAAMAVGFVTGLSLLGLFGVIGPDDTFTDITGMVALQAVPCAIGAMVANKQLGAGAREGDDRAPRVYGGELFLMAAGAVFIAFNVAPTEEMVLIAYRMSPWHSLALALTSIAVLHAIVYRVGFAGEEQQDHPVTAFAHYSLVGYAIALLVSLYVLWTFGRTDGQSLAGVVSTVIVLGFPASIGAAAARLLV